MLSIYTPAQVAGITQIFANAPVRPVRAIVANDERVGDPRVDRWEPSSSAAPMPQVTYGRTGLGASAPGST